MSSYNQDRLRRLVKNIDHENKKLGDLDEEIKVLADSLGRAKRERSNLAYTILKMVEERDYLQGEED